MNNLSKKIIVLISLTIKAFSLTIKIPLTDEVMFINGKTNPVFNSTFYLPICESQEKDDNRDTVSYSISLLPTETLPSITLYTNTEKESYAYFTLVQNDHLKYSLTVNNICTNEKLDSSLLAHVAVQNPKIKKSSSQIKIFRLDFKYKNDMYVFYLSTQCNKISGFKSIITFIPNFIIYMIIIFLVTMFHINFQIVNIINTYTRLKFWVGPVVILVLSVGVILAYYFSFAFWVINFAVVGITSSTCSQTLQWILTELCEMETKNKILQKIQKFFLYELFCTVNVLSLTCSLALKIVFIIWVATQWVVLGNLMSFCFIFVVVSSVRVTKFKNCFWLLLSMIIYELGWDIVSNTFFNLNINLYISQSLGAPTGIQTKNFSCWTTTYLSEIIFPALALKFCKTFDKLEKDVRSYYIFCFILIIIAQVVTFTWKMKDKYLIIITIILIVGLGLKGLKDRMFLVFWRGVKKESLLDGAGVEVNSDDEDEGDEETMMCKVELKHIL